MRYIKDLHEGETIRNVYLCKGRRSAWRFRFSWYLTAVSKE